MAALPNRRDIKRAAVYFLLFIATLLGFAIINRIQLNSFKNQLFQTQAAQTKPIAGHDGYTPVKGVDYFDGENGQDGRDGANGKNGKDGKSLAYNDLTPDQKAALKGDTGPQGAQGDPGRTIYIDSEKGLCKYAGDDDWQPIGECK